MRRLLALLVLGLGGLAGPAHAAVTDCASAPVGATWCKETGATALSAPVGTTSLGYPRTFVANGGSLEILDSGTGALVHSVLGVGTVSNRPMPVRFASGARAVFVASNTGYLFRIDPETGACVWKTFLGRTDATDITPGCTGSVTAACPGDMVTATPAVRFGATENASMVYVGTRYTTSGGACATTSRNRFYALNAATGDPVWVFNSATGAGSPYRNANGSTAVDFIAEGAYPDVYEDGCGSPGIRDQLYVGADDQGSQDTGWAINALTGSVVALGAIGGIQTTPILSFNPQRCERLYVATKSSPLGLPALGAIGLTPAACGGGNSPCILWATFTSGPVFLTPSVVQTGANRGRILVTSNNRVQLFVDNGSNATASCSYGGTTGLEVSSQPLILSTNGFAYVGQRDGRVAQVALSNCAASATLRTLQAGSVVGDASLDADAQFQNPFIVVGNDAGRLGRFNVPW